MIPRDIAYDSSYVLGLRIEPYALELSMDFALLPEHPEYMPPEAGEQHCYLRGALKITGFRRVFWSATGFPPAQDVTGEADFGTLDELKFMEEVWHLSGDWGTIVLEGGTLAIRVDRDGR